MLFGEGVGGSHEKGSGVSNDECRSGNIMNLASCQTSEDDWLVVGHTGLKSSSDTWTDDVEFGLIVEFWALSLHFYDSYEVSASMFTRNIW